MMKYKFQSWHKQKGTIPVLWTDADYTVKTTWRSHGNKYKGFTVSSEMLEIYNNNIGVLIPESVLPIFDQVIEFFDLNNLVCDLSKYTPGMILPWHTDDYPTYSKNMGVTDIADIVRVIVFLHDSQPGHQLWIEDRFCSGRAGSWFSWEGKTKHMAANLGETDRYVIQLTGTKK